MPTATLPTFAVTVSAGSPAEAIAKLDRYVEGGDHHLAVAGFASTGRAGARNERWAAKGLYEVEVEDRGGDRDDLWVVLTSYGMSPADDLGSCWQSVKGLGR